MFYSYNFNIYEIIGGFCKIDFYSFPQHIKCELLFDTDLLAIHINERHKNIDCDWIEDALGQYETNLPREKCRGPSEELALHLSRMVDLGYNSLIRSIKTFEQNIMIRKN